MPLLRISLTARSVRTVECANAARRGFRPSVCEANRTLKVATLKGGRTGAAAVASLLAAWGSAAPGAAAETIAMDATAAVTRNSKTAVRVAARAALATAPVLLRMLMTSGWELLVSRR